MCLFRPTAPRDLEDPRDPNLTLILTILDPFEGPGGRLRLGPARAAFGLEDLLEPLKPMPGTSNFGHFDHFSYWKVNFVILPIRVSENAILTLFWPHFEPSWAQTFGLWPKCAYLGPLPWRDLGGTLEGPQIWPYFDHFDPFEGPEEVAARPLHELPLGWKDLFGALKPMPGTSNFGHFDHFSYWKSQFWTFCLSGVSENAILTLFWPILSPPEPQPLAPGQMCLFRPTARMGPWRDPWGTPNLTLFWPFWTLWGSWGRLR